MTPTRSARRLMVTALLLVLSSSGCASHAKSAGTESTAARHPASADTVQATRQAYYRAYPDSRVGVIIATRPQDRLVAVGDVNSSDFTVGQTVYFLDAKRHVMTTGRIVRLLNDSIHAQYVEPSGGHRPPAAGDMMVRLPIGGTPLP